MAKTVNGGGGDPHNQAGDHAGQKVSASLRFVGKKISSTQGLRERAGAAYEDVISRTMTATDANAALRALELVADQNKVEMVFASTGIRPRVVEFAVDDVVEQEDLKARRRQELLTELTALES